MRVPSPFDLLNPWFYKRALGSATRRLLAAMQPYKRRMAHDQRFFGSQHNIHELPEIFHYWSNKYLRPTLEQFGFSNPDEFYALYAQRALENSASRQGRIVSVGAGNCDTEVRLAQTLITRGVVNFVIECVDINPEMLARGVAHAKAAGVADQIIVTERDFNKWTSPHRYDVVMANQSLHHVLKLEQLFETIKSALLPDGVFICSDIMGRNGHLRWPEALKIVDEYWQELPESYRWNLQLNRAEHRFQDWDCSTDSFEGIRAQDILPLLIAHFEFDLFIPFANVIDPFIDRSFGHHFDVSQQWDREFIDKVHARDTLEIASQTITPTHFMAVMCTGRAGKNIVVDGLHPRQCVRKT